MFDTNWKLTRFEFKKSQIWCGDGILEWKWKYLFSRTERIIKKWTLSWIGLIQQQLYNWNRSIICIKIFNNAVFSIWVCIIILNKLNYLNLWCMYYSIHIICHFDMAKHFRIMSIWKTISDDKVEKFMYSLKFPLFCCWISAA